MNTDTADHSLAPPGHKVSKYVELAPGARVLYAEHGLVNLGAPLGEEDWSRAHLCGAIRKHDKRLKALIRLAQHTGEEARSNGRLIGLQCALTALRYSANARDVHFLRAMPRRLVQDAAELHDRGIMVTAAAG